MNAWHRWCRFKQNCGTSASQAAANGGNPARAQTVESRAAPAQERGLRRNDLDGRSQRRRQPGRRPTPAAHSLTPPRASVATTLRRSSGWAPAAGAARGATAPNRGRQHGQPADLQRHRRWRRVFAAANGTIDVRTLDGDERPSNNGTRTRGDRRWRRRWWRQRLRHGLDGWWRWWRRRRHRATAVGSVVAPSPSASRSPARPRPRGRVVNSAQAAKTMVGPEAGQLAAPRAEDRQ